MKVADVRLRSETNADVPFLRKLFGTTRIDVTFSSLPDQQKQQFIEMQFVAQRQHYRKTYQNAQFLIIESGEKRIGRLYLSRMESEIRIMDITLMPEARGNGIGSKLIRDVQDEARASGLAVTLHAEKMGQMSAYYERFGFEVVEEKEAHFFMKWNPKSVLIIE